MPYSTDSVNIKSLQAYVVNSTMQTEITDDLRKKTRFLGRFPRELFIYSYESTAYDIKSCGYPSYRAFPHDYAIEPYHGFGVYPRWRDIYSPLPNCKLTEYRAKVKSTSDKDVVEVFFPAEEQLFTGKYNLIIVAKIYQDGYACNNLRTITMDWRNIFTLVDNSDEEGVDNAVTLEVIVNGEEPTIVPDPGTDDETKDVYVTGGDVDKSRLRLNRSSADSVDIDMTPITGWDEIE